MDIQQLQLLAGRIRNLLQQSNRQIGHSQSLDFIAALPGLRNWPEVKAFPARVASCRLEESSAGRLAFRIKKKLGLDFSAVDILAALTPTDSPEHEAVPEIWPSGPYPGVYVTTSQKAIDALLECYEDATDGALVYAERAASEWKGSIDLGDSGLWSAGLSRVPSGNLIVVGPLELSQQGWNTSASRLEMACLHAQTTGHRIAVLLETATPETACEDAHLMVRMSQPEGDDCETALLGVVTEDGQMQRRVPFARPWPSAVDNAGTLDVTATAIPDEALPALRKAFTRRTAGLVLFGSSVDQEHWGMGLICASLPLTAHLGPAARIRPRKRRTPSKDWLVPDPIKQLPFLPSVESAYEQGYRRLIINPHYTSADLLVKYGNEVMFFIGTYGSVADEMWMNALRPIHFQREAELLTLVAAILGVTHIPTTQGNVTLTDLYVEAAEDALLPTKARDTERFFEDHRLLKWQDTLGPLLDSGQVTAADIRDAIQADRAVAKFLSIRQSP